MAKVVSFIIQKGGCGKTTTTANTAGYLAMHGFQVLAVDMDPQGNLTQHMGYDTESLDHSILDLFEGQYGFDEVILQRNETLHLLPNNLKTASAEFSLQKNSLNPDFLLRDVLAPVMNRYDYVLLDCPPAIGLFSINALAASTEFVLVVSPEFFPMKAIKPLYETFRMVKSKLNHSLQFNGIIMTMCDFRTRHSQEVRSILKKNFPHKLYNAYIRMNVSLKEASSYGQTIFEYNPHSFGAFDYQNFAEEFIRDHHKNICKKQYYQQKFETLSPGEQNQIIMFAEQSLSAFVKNGIDNADDDSSVLHEALVVERNKVLEKLFPYRMNNLVEDQS
ncbi:MAG: ParA family protein [Calditrichaeota bacterium]|nr:ParA family protein [Calditrichota bacterium]